MTIFTERKIDCHNHIFDPAGFPYQPDTPYAPSGHEITTAEYFHQVLDAYGVSHALIVGPNSAYGEDDNRALIDAIARSNGRFKGMAVVSKDVTDATLAGFKAQGIVGVTFNVAYYGPEHFAHAAELMDRLHRFGLLAQIQTQGEQILAFADVLFNTPATVVIDHCGRPDLNQGLNSEAFKMLEDIGRAGRHFIKLSGMAKFSEQAYPFTDTKPYVEALFAAYGEDRVLWGSDWPFLMAPQRMDYGTLLTLAKSWFPDTAQRGKYLWKNASRLYGFD